MPDDPPGSDTGQCAVLDLSKRDGKGLPIRRLCMDQSASIKHPFIHYTPLKERKRYNALQRNDRPMADFTRHQKKIIDRYYENKSDIMLTKLSELVGELYLADSDKKRDRLWERVGLAMKNLKVKPEAAARVLESRDPKLLANYLKDWLQAR